jgi:hypothetical protein
MTLFFNFLSNISNLVNKASLFCFSLIGLAGLPAYIAEPGKDLRTQDLAARTAFDPIVTCGPISLLPAIVT